MHRRSSSPPDRRIATFLALGLSLLGGGNLLGQAPPDPDRVDLLPRDQEMTIALSAAPAHLRDGAGVWLLQADGWVEGRESSNGITCVINRDHPLNRKPVCYDAEGTATILPKVKFFGEQLLKGISVAEVNRLVGKGFEEGRFIAPRRPGVAYMLTKEIRTWNPNTQRFGTFPPHVMFYAPNLTNADIGWTPEGARATPGLPFIAYQGPHGFMVVVPPNGG